ncbi:hypothetical protein V8G54_014559 [Vigna mungo]|uniref:Uncharacterized protein n=1 Tax=Vigna mungo TaxID=3915 RepID=A0AAQ3RW13_VIGMU
MTIGVVMKVVNNAMTTQMANAWSFSTLRSLPMLRTMSTTKPFVFMRNPRARASLEGTLNSNETTVVPIIFPKQALNITSISIAQERPPLIVATSVFKPLDTKYSGMKRPETRSSILSVNTPAKEPSLGITVPTTKAPKSE